MTRNPKLYEYEIPLNWGNWKTRKGLILEWNGGLGEIAPLPGFSRETFEEARSEIVSLLPNLSSAKPKLASVRFGLSCASKPFSLEPIRVPLCSLGPRPGFALAKLKVGHLPLQEAIAQAKEHSKSCRLRIDCNRAWTLEEALEFASHFAPTDFDYLEEPVKTLPELIQFSQKTLFPIAIDESLLDSPTASIPSLKALVVKPTILGSIPPIPPHLALTLSSSFETGLGLLHIARLARKNCLPAGLDTYRFLQEDLLSSPIDCSMGFFSWTPSSGPFLKMEKLCPVH